MRSTFARSTLAVVALSFGLAACESPTSTTSPDPRTPSAPGGFNFALVPGDPIARPASASQLGELFIVCKTGPTATFDVTEVSPNPGFLRTITVNDGECVLAAAFGNVSREIEVTENVPAGAQLVDVQLTQLTCGAGQAKCGGSQIISGPNTAGNPVTGFVGGGAGALGLSGALADFTNRLIPTGGEGCTPGYWKNHTGLKSQTNQWPPTGFGQGDSFDATFGVSSSFGGTLLEALNRGGGGENALGRHAVAALLNAAHPGVSYDLDVAGVISEVQSAYSGGDFESSKNVLAAFNEQGCPIGN